MSKQFHSLTLLGTLLATTLLLSACSHTDSGRITESSSAPEWAQKFAASFSDMKNGVLYGVGIAQGIRNKPLAIETADLRAQANIANELNRYVAQLQKDYMESAAGGADLKNNHEEQMVTNALKGFTKVTLTGAIITDHFRDSDGSIYSLCKLDLDAIKKTLRNYQGMSTEMRRAIEKHADKAFHQLSKAENQQ